MKELEAEELDTDPESDEPEDEQEVEGEGEEKEEEEEEPEPESESEADGSADSIAELASAVIDDVDAEVESLSAKPLLAKADARDAILSVLGLIRRLAEALEMV